MVFQPYRTVYLLLFPSNPVKVLVGLSSSKWMTYSSVDNRSSHIIFLKKYISFDNVSFTKELHINAMQRYAHAAFRDGLDQPTIQCLASLACWGRHEQNSERDFHKAIPFLYGSELPTHSIAVDTWDSDNGQVVTMEVPVLLASDVLHEIWKKDSPKLWNAAIGATSQRTHAFWNAFQREQSSWDHPVFQPSGSNEICFLCSLQIFYIGLFQFGGTTKYLVRSSHCFGHLRSNLGAESFPAPRWYCQLFLDIDLKA